jgi:secreted trypsin-like serine protease
MGTHPARRPFANEGTVRIVDAGFADLLFTVLAPGNPCSGDSGGPLLVNGVVVGIVNFGESQCNGVTGYSRVSQLTSWIDSVLADSQTSTSAMRSSA